LFEDSDSDDDERKEEQPAEKAAGDDAPVDAVPTHEDLFGDSDDNSDEESDEELIPSNGKRRKDDGDQGQLPAKKRKVAEL
jgi:hypothetical protein